MRRMMNSDSRRRALGASTRTQEDPLLQPRLFDEDASAVDEVTSLRSRRAHEVRFALSIGDVNDQLPSTQLGHRHRGPRHHAMPD